MISLLNASVEKQTHVVGDKDGQRADVCKDAHSVDGSDNSVNLKIGNFQQNLCCASHTASDPPFPP